MIMEPDLATAAAAAAAAAVAAVELLLLLAAAREPAWLDLAAVSQGLARKGRHAGVASLAEAVAS